MMRKISLLVVIFSVILSVGMVPSVVNASQHNDSNVSERERLQNLIQQKNARISNLEDKLDKRQQKIDQLEQKNQNLRDNISRLNQTLTNLSNRINNQDQQQQPGFTVLVSILAIISGGLLLRRERK